MIPFSHSQSHWFFISDDTVKLKLIFEVIMRFILHLPWTVG